MPRVRFAQSVGAPRLSPLLVPRVRAHPDVLLAHGLKLRRDAQKAAMSVAMLFLLLAASANAADFPAWMAGSWGGTVGGVKMEEHWTAADGGVMVGMHRDVRPNGKVFFEFLRIEKRDGVLAYVAQPGGRPATAFPLKSIDASSVVFENLQHDFPQRIIYRRDGDRLCARLEGPASAADQPEEWCWIRLAR